MIVHVKRAEFDVYIGKPASPTPHHWGSPFAKGDLASFDAWLDGTAYQDIEPERRLWILNNLPALAGKTLGCWCEPNAPCHGQSLARLAQSAVDAMTAFAAPNEPLSYVWQGGKRVHICTVLGQGLSPAEQAKYNRLRAEARRLHPEYYEVKK